MTTKKRGKMRMPLETAGHGIKAWKEADAIINPKCPFVLRCWLSAELRFNKEWCFVSPISMGPRRLL